MVQRYGDVYFLSRNQNPSLMAALLFIDCSSFVSVFLPFLDQQLLALWNSGNVWKLNKASFLQIRNGDLEGICTWEGSTESFWISLPDCLVYFFPLSTPYLYPEESCCSLGPQICFSFYFSLKLLFYIPEALSSPRSQEITLLKTRALWETYKLFQFLVPLPTFLAPKELRTDSELEWDGERGKLRILTCFPDSLQQSFEVDTVTILISQRRKLRLREVKLPKVKQLVSDVLKPVSNLSFVCSYAYSGFPGGSVVKNPPVNAGDIGSIPGLGRSPGVGHDNPLQYS